MSTRKIESPTRKIAEPPPRRCRDPQHDPAKHRVYEPGTYEHTCPSCGVKQIFTVSRAEWSAGVTKVPEPFYAARLDNIARHSWT